MNPPLKVAVVGVGHLGKIHAAIYHRLPDVELVAVADTDAPTAAAVAAHYNCAAYDCASKLAGKIDAASVVVPTSMHRHVATTLLKNQIHLLVEKPIAATVADAAAIVELARARGVILQIGHVERFNAGVIKLAERAAAPRFIEVHRLGKFVARGVDVDVVADLMIHDIDLAIALMPAPLKTVVATGARVLTSHVDIANARLEFADGAVANVTASRVSRKSLRRIRVFSADAYLGLNFKDQQLDYISLASSRGADGFPELIERRIEVRPRPPLDAELGAFVDCVLRNKKPLVSGEDGLQAVRVAQQVRRKIAASMAAH